MSPRPRRCACRGRASSPRARRRRARCRAARPRVDGLERPVQLVLHGGRDSENSRLPVSSPRSSHGWSLRARHWQSKIRLTSAELPEYTLKRAVADEAAQEDAVLAGEVHRQRGRRADGHDAGEAGQRRLLHQLERDAAAEAGEQRRGAGSGQRAAARRSPCPSRCGGRRPRARQHPPASSNSAVAWRPPVRSKRRLLRGAARPGRQRVAGHERGPAPGARRLALTCSSAALPHTPHDEVRWNAARPRVARQPAVRSHLDDVRREVVGGPARSRRRPARSAPRRIRNPTASSSSSPGVRIVTATACPSTRISSGSSTASSSARVSAPARCAEVASAT